MKHWKHTQQCCLVVTIVFAVANAFTPPSPVTMTIIKNRQHDFISFLLKSSNFDNDSHDAPTTTYWNPPLRKFISGLSSIGALETAYLTYSKLQGNVVSCPIDASSSSCQDVLNGPYSVLPPIVSNLQIPLAAVGCIVYTITAGIAVAPLLIVNHPDDTINRYALVAITTSLATVSTFLWLLLNTVLHTVCPYCLLSIGLSWTVAATTYFGQALPNLISQMSTIISSVMLSTLVSVFVYGGMSTADALASSSSSSSLGLASATATAVDDSVNIPPPITTKSSSQALQIASMLREANTKMYGAFWCSHCYDQKQTLGLPAFQSIQYIECSRDGYQSQADQCRERNIPGYPTWEINGELYPGEQTLEELQQIISKSSLD
jgi:uncharacterized membrane protein